MDIKVTCNICGKPMVYHASYEVNYKSEELCTKITILRYKCKKCNVTHSLKPDFLASRHQYDTFQREKYILNYTYISNKKASLRKLSSELFPSLLVSHTVMYYWVRAAADKNNLIEPILAKGMQEYLPSCDISSELLPEVLDLPTNTRDKSYSKTTAKLINWGRIYIKKTAEFMKTNITDYDSSPFKYINRILDTLTAHTFL